MSRPGGPGWDRGAAWAFRLADRGRFSARREPPYTAYGVTITRGLVPHGYGRSTHASAYLTHIPRDLLLAWRGGRFKVAQMTWRCGSRTLHFHLLEEPDSVICPACTIERPDRRRGRG